MIISRNMRIALLISLFWHLFCLSSVSIIFLPRGLEPRSDAAVNFLGSILKSPISFAQGPASGEAGLVNFPAEAEIPRVSNFSARPYPYLRTEKDISGSGNIVDIDASANEGLFAASFIFQKSSGQKREIIFQPARPEYPEWTRQELKTGCVVFKIFISPDGLVQEIINLQSSANPEIDAALARYIKRWRFAPTADTQGQWQTVKLNLDS